MLTAFQTVSSLHKQNFDLKLELFHRREKQSKLENRIETLESEKSQVEDINDQLVRELEKRDKAVEEAVAMIIVLEARVEQLLKEREMVGQVEADGLFYPETDSQDSEADLTMKTMQTLEPPKLASGLQHDPNVLARMPSFLSEQSEHTENLRNVYLRARSSVISLSKSTDEAGDENVANVNGLTSPSLSVLSESSFMSVYGRTNAQVLPLPPPEELSLDGCGDKHNDSKSSGRGASSARMGTPTKPKRNQSQNRNIVSTAFSSINDILDGGGSPLQKLERLENTLTAMNEASRPTTKGSTSKIQQSPSRQQKSRPHGRTKEEKRAALRKVLTDAPVTVDFNNPQAFPPTPDTVATSVLRRGQSSDDNLVTGRAINHESSDLALSEEASTKSAGEEVANNRKESTASQALSMSLLDRRELMGHSYFDGRAPIAQRPRSADETTISHRSGAHGWESDSSGGDADAVSGSDYWLCESLRPCRASGRGDRDASNSARGGYASPDLFSFPSGRDGWATDAMFGSLGGAGYLGSAGSAPLSQTLDALGASLPHPQAGFYGSGLASPLLLGGLGDIVPPPPPNRRSSLHARTGSTSASGSATPVRPGQAGNKLRTSSTLGATGAGTARSNSMDGSAQRGMQLPSQHHRSHAPQAPYQQPGLALTEEQQQLAAAPQNQRHYPPISGVSQPTRSRGISNLFRRSTGSGDVRQQQQPPASAPPAKTTFTKMAEPTAGNGPIPMVGIPSWGRRAELVDDGRSSATPPPIVRNRVPRQGSVSAGGENLAPGPSAVDAAMNFEGVVAGVSAAATTLPPQAQAALPTDKDPAAARPAAAETGTVEEATGDDGTGGKRRWFGLGRKASLRNKTG